MIRRRRRSRDIPFSFRLLLPGYSDRRARTNSIIMGNMVVTLLGWAEVVRDVRSVCLVEGVMDLLALRQWQIPGLAIAGTSLHADRLEQLKGFERVYLALDSDQAGQHGADRIGLQLGRRAVRVRLPLGVKDVGAEVQIVAVRTAEGL